MVAILDFGPGHFFLNNNNNNNNTAFIKRFTPKSLSALQRNNTNTKIKLNRKDIHNQKLRQGIDNQHDQLLQNAMVNKYVFKEDLNCSTVFEFLIYKGRVFQSSGAA